MQTTDYNIPVFNNEDVADLNKYSNQMANALKTQLDRFGNPLLFKGNVVTVADLPTEAAGGWIYNVTDENKNYVYSGTEWVIYSENFDTGNLATLDNVKELEEGIAGVDAGKLDKMVVSKTLNTAGWYRVAKYNNYGTYGRSFIMNLYTRYLNSHNMATTFAINFVNGQARITNISSLIREAVVTNIRIVRDDDEFYVEIYYAKNVANPVCIDILNQTNQDYTTERYLSMLDFEAPTDTATVLDELLITQDELDVTSLLRNGWTKHSGCQIFKHNNIVHVALNIKDGTARDIIYLPEGYRPKELMYFPLVIDGSPSTASYCSVSSSGALQGSNSTPNKLLFINFSYKV